MREKSVKTDGFLFTCSTFSSGHSGPPPSQTPRIRIRMQPRSQSLPAAPLKAFSLNSVRSGGTGTEERRSPVQMIRSASSARARPARCATNASIKIKRSDSVDFVWRHTPSQLVSEDACLKSGGSAALLRPADRCGGGRAGARCGAADWRGVHWGRAGACS